MSRAPSEWSCAPSERVSASVACCTQGLHVRTKRSGEGGAAAAPRGKHGRRAKASLWLAPTLSRWWARQRESKSVSSWCVFTTSCLGLFTQEAHCFLRQTSKDFSLCCFTPGKWQLTSPFLKHSYGTHSSGVRAMAPSSLGCRQLRGTKSKKGLRIFTDRMDRR